MTGWIVSQGQDAFDSIALYAEELRLVAEQADREVIATWTELPHRWVARDSWDQALST